MGIFETTSEALSTTVVNLCLKFSELSEKNPKMSDSENTPDKMKVAELRAALQERGLDTKGTKPVLVGRLQAAPDAEKPPEEEAAPKDPADESVVEEKKDDEAMETEVESKEEKTEETPVKKEATEEEKKKEE